MAFVCFAHVFYGCRKRPHTSRCSASADELEAQLSDAPAAATPAPAYLVGTGPGDPGLLTLHAWSVIQKASVVLHDKLVSAEILALVHPGAVLVDVGKRAANHAVEGPRLRNLLVRCALAGRTTIRLKGGDPSIFGREGPELSCLQENGVDVFVVPGVTTASAAAAALSMPLTALDVAGGVAFVSFHDVSEDSRAAYKQDMTYVLYMSFSKLKTAARQLISGGLRSDTPAAAVERGTMPGQRAAFAPLCELDQVVRSVQMATPCLIIVGDVVALSPYWKQWHTRTDTLEGPAKGMMDFSTWKDFVVPGRSRAEH
mmetsp:Transcript_12636/g.38674  ORF Transcript_12636/g.38674 Transcript_12636/m.38674 type:complete len:314 (+) Transcript_12636:89-1030(+)